MGKKLSTQLEKNLHLISALCDPQTTKRIVAFVLKTADRDLVHGLLELLLNVKGGELEKLAKGVTLKQPLIKKRKTIIRNWKRIRDSVGPLVKQLLNDEISTPKFRNPGGDDNSENNKQGDD